MRAVPGFCVGYLSLNLMYVSPLALPLLLRSSLVETEASKASRMAVMQQEYQQQLLQLQKEGKPEPPKPQLQERQPPRVQTINKLLYTLSSLTCKPGPAWFVSIVEAWRRQFS